MWLTGVVASDATGNAKMHAHYTVTRNAGTMAAPEAAVETCQNGEIGNQASAGRVSVPRVAITDDQFAASGTVFTPAGLTFAKGDGWGACYAAGTSGNVTELSLPEGHYTIDTTFRFWKS
jgi:hypothetical protein